METAASVIAVVQLSTSIVTACNKYLNSVRHAAEEIRDLREGVEAYLATIQKLRELTASTNRDRLVVLGSLNDLIEKSETALREIETRLNGKSSNPMRRWGWRAMKWPFTKDEVNDTLKRLGQWRDTLSTALLADNFSQSLNIARALDRTEQSRYLEKLPRVAQAAFDSRSQQHDPHCLPGTRTEILQRLVSWSYDHDSEPICWLRGMAGTGKSTIARTVASLLHDEGCLGGSFFFSRSAGDRGHAGKLMSTLAVQLAKKDSQLKQGICDAVLEDEDISQRSLAEQCSRLIVHPLKKLNGSTAFPLVFVIDALDECDNEDDIELIPQLLTMIVDARTRYRVRILISARPERAVRRGFHQVESALHHELNLFDIDEAVVKSDISLLIGHELTKIRSRHGLPDSWPSFKDEVIDILSTRAGTLFIYAMTVCRFIQSSPSPQRALSIITKDGLDTSPEQGQSPTSMLDEMYLTLLKHSYVGDPFLFRRVLGSIVLLNAEFSINALSSLLSVSESTVSSVLHNLYSVLHVPSDKNDSLYVLHPSFRDFLLDNKRCTDSRFRLDEKELHGFIAYNCMRNMQRCLRPDLCGLVIPGCIPDDLKQAEIAEKIQFETSYACRSWVYHIQKAGLEADIVYRFIKSRVLQWLEALAWLQELYTGIYMVQSLREMRNLQGHSQLRCALYDLYRYLMQHRSIIEKAPLQIYHCLVSFSPERSFMRKIFSNLTRCAVLRTGSLPVAWSPCVQTWENVARISVSPSMDMVACVTVSGTLELRKTMTGRCMNVLNHTLFGSSTPIDCLVFSANGSMLLTAVRNRAQIWSTKLGMLIHDLHGRCDPVSHAVFGNDDKLVATMSRRGKVIKLWDTCGGALTKTLEGHTDGILCVDFSKDGRCIVSSSLDKTIRVWDWRNGTTLHELKGHTGEIDTISFTSAGDQVLSYSTEDGTLRLWDAAKGTFHYVHKTSSVTAVAILRDHGIIAYAAVDYAIALWNLNTKILIRTFGDHSRRVFSLCFSANGRRLASKSSDHTIRVWDVKTGNCIQTLDSFGFPNMEFLTEDGDRIIYSDIEECGIWECGGDAATEAKSPNCSQIVTLAHSPDSNVLLSVAKNGTLAIWDMRTGSCMHAPGDLDGDIVTKAVLSSDGSKAACLTNGGELRLLDTNSRNWVHIFKCWIEEVQFCFSPSVTYFAYVTNSRLYIRKVETGELVLETDLLVRGPRIHFSPHSDVIIVMSDDGTAQLCTLPSMVAGLESLDGCMTWLPGLGLSIVNDLPINQSESAIRFWDIHTKRSRSMLRKRSGLRQLRCSGDGKVIVAMYSDGQVQVWSPETEDCAYVRHQPLDSSVLTVSASGETAVALSSGTEMTLWNPTTGKSHSIYTDETVVCSALAPSVKRLVSGCSDCTLRLFNLESHQWQGRWKLPSKILAVAISPDGQKILSWTEENTLQLWDTADYRCISSRKGFLTEPASNSFSPDNKRIASIAQCDTKLEIWSTNEAILLHTLQGHAEAVYFIGWSPDSETLASSSGDRTIRLWNVATGICSHVFDDCYVDGLEPRFTDDNTLFLYQSGPLSVKIYNYQTGELIFSHVTDSAKAILQDARFSKDNDPLLLTKNHTKFEVWSVSTGRRLGSTDRWVLFPAAFSRDATLVLTNCYAWDYRLNSFAEGPPQWTLESKVYFWGDGKDLTACSQRKSSSLEVMSLKDGRTQKLIEIEKPCAIACSRRGAFVAYTRYGLDHVCLWEIHPMGGGITFHKLPLPQIGALLLRFSLDESTLVAVQDDGPPFVIVSWDLATRSRVPIISDPGYVVGRIVDITLSREGRVLATIHESHLIHIWDAARGECVFTIPGHSDWVREPFFSADHHLLAVISAENAVLVWDMQASQLIARFPFTKTLYGVSISEDGLYITVNDGLSETALSIKDGACIPHSAFYWVSFCNDWIMWKGHKVICIPLEYRGTLAKLHRNTVILGSNSGQVLFIELDPDLDPTKWSFEDPLARDPDLLIREESLADYPGVF